MNKALESRKELLGWRKLSRGQEHMEGEEEEEVKLVKRLSHGERIRIKITQ